MESNFGVFDGVIRMEISRGYLAVDLFFMLSGFVLSHVYGRTFGAEFTWNDRRLFLWSRLARIYPVHVVTLIMLLPLYGKPGFSGTSLIENLFFIQIFLAPTLTWNGGAWSIGAEWYAYLLFPLIVMPLLKRARPVFAAAILGLSFAPAAAFTIAHGNGNIAVGPSVFARALPEFTAGMLLYRCFAAGSLARVWRSDTVCLCCFGAIVVLAALPRTEILIIVLLGVLLLCSAHNGGNVAAFLQVGPVLFLGQVSYSLYMLQAPVYFATMAIRSHGIVTDPVALATLMAALSFAVAVPISKYVEYPARDLIRGMLNTSGLSRRREKASN